MKEYEILGVKIDGLTTGEVLDFIESKIKQNKSAQIATVNNEFIVEALNNKKFKDVLNSCDLNTIDSTGVKWAIRKKYKENPERLPGSDLFLDICRFSAERGYRIFLLGSQSGVGTLAAQKMIKMFKGLHVVGVNEGKVIDENKIEPALIDEINSSNADIVFVALGAPRQDLWISNNIKKLKPAVCIGIGGTLDYVSGKVKRAPKAWRSLGLEWLYRFFMQPKRFTRILKAVVVFPLMVIFNPD